MASGSLGSVNGTTVLGGQYSWPQVDSNTRPQLSACKKLLQQVEEKFRAIFEAATSSDGFRTSDRVASSHTPRFPHLVAKLKACVAFLSFHNYSLSSEISKASSKEEAQRCAMEDRVHGLLDRTLKGADAITTDVSAFEVLENLASDTHQACSKTAAAQCPPDIAVTVNVPGPAASGSALPAPLAEGIANATKWISEKVKDSPAGQVAVKVLAGAVLMAAWGGSIALTALGMAFSFGASIFVSAAVMTAAATVSTSFFSSLWEALKYEKAQRTLNVKISGGEPLTS